MLLAVWSISAGDFPIPFGDVVATLFGQGQGSNKFIVFGLRLPRLLTGIAVGIAFGISGAIFQSLARNPLASPDIIGFNSGAALGAVTMIIVFGATGVVVALGALGGGLITARRSSTCSSCSAASMSPLRLVLVGIGVGFAAYAGVEFLMTRSDIFEAAAAQAWLTGSLNARVWLARRHRRHRPRGAGAGRAARRSARSTGSSSATTWRAALGVQGRADAAPRGDRRRAARGAGGGLGRTDRVRRAGRRARSRGG